MKFSEVISDFEQINFQSAPKAKYEAFAGYLRHQAADVYPEGWLEARYVTPDAVQFAQSRGRPRIIGLHAQTLAALSDVLAPSRREGAPENRYATQRTRTDLMAF